MTEAVWCLRALLSHWRRSPFQLFVLLLGLMVATALWSGVQAINSQARQSYDKAANLLGEKDLSAISSVTSPYFSDTAFGYLRRLGWNVSPILEGEISVDGNHYRLIGIDPLSYPANVTTLPIDKKQDDLIAFIHPGRTILNPDTYDKIRTTAENWKTDNGKPLPPALKQEAIPPNLLIVDIGIAQGLLDKPGLLSKLLVSPLQNRASLNSASLSGLNLQLSSPSETVSVDGLTESFHLNLTAFGFLSFFVGLFIVHSAIGLAFEQRRSMVRTLRACGVSARKLAMVMLGELLIFALFAGSIGVIAGYGIAAALLPDVTASLRGLYGAQVSGELSLQLSWWFLGLGMSVLGALFAAASSLYKAYRLPVLAPAAPNAWRVQQILLLKRQAAVALILFFCAVLLPLVFGGLVSAFLMMGCLLLGSALLLPFVLSLILNLG
ncbi:MAG: ABC transporter permease, partial [Sneathiella sp.]|nr:ABC transporter permease [Sneathiella sp.]